MYEDGLFFIFIFFKEELSILLGRTGFWAAAKGWFLADMQFGNLVSDEINRFCRRGSRIANLRYENRQWDHEGWLIIIYIRRYVYTHVPYSTYNTRIG